MSIMQPDLDFADLRRISDLIYEKYNYDFRNYAPSSFKRRVVRILEQKKMTVNHLLEKLALTPHFIHEFIDELTVNVTEMFRDPGFWKVIRHEVLPSIRRQRSKFNIWHAGCSSGEEVITMSIVLHEMNMQDDVLITATDLDTGMLRRAGRGACAMKHMEVNERNYLAFGGDPSGLGKYYIRDNDHALFHRSLFDRVTFRHHDLVLGEVFDRFDLILCRNVMIYFNQDLQNTVLKKFHESLTPSGYLSIGSRESLIWCEYGNRFTIVNNDEKIYKKIKN